MCVLRGAPRGLVQNAVEVLFMLPDPHLENRQWGSIKKFCMLRFPILCYHDLALIQWLHSISSAAVFFLSIFAVPSPSYFDYGNATTADGATAAN